VENGWLEQSPAKPLKAPKVEPTDVVPFTEEEIEKILKACDAYGSKGVPVGYVATVLGDSEIVVRKHYSKWVSERQNPVDAAIRASWEPLSGP
jgi:hypothetical protein